MAGKVTAAYHMTNVTCGLTAKKPGSAPYPTLTIEYGTTVLTSHKSGSPQVMWVSPRFSAEFYGLSRTPLAAL